MSPAFAEWSFAVACPKATRSPPLSEETVLGLASLGNAGRPSLAPQHSIYIIAGPHKVRSAVRHPLFIARHEDAAFASVAPRRRTMTNNIDLGGRIARGHRRCARHRPRDCRALPRFPARRLRSGIAISRWRKRRLTTLASTGRVVAVAVDVARLRRRRARAATKRSRRSGASTSSSTMPASPVRMSTPGSIRSMPGAR